MNKKPVIEQAANRFYMEFESGFQAGNPFDTSRFKSLLPSTLYDWNEGEDQLIFLKAIEAKINTEKQQHFTNHNHGEGTSCPETNFYNELLYFTNQAMEKVISTGSTSETFSLEERVEINARIDEVLNRMDEMKSELQSGQEVIFYEIDELKNLTNLKKKTFKEVVKGKIFEMAVQKALDPKILARIYETLIGDEIPKLLQ